MNGISVGLGLTANLSIFCLVSGALLENLEKCLRKCKGISSILLQRIVGVLRWMSIFHHRLLLITTVTGYLASFLIFALAIAATKHFAKPPEVGWTQAYFFAIFSGGTYFVISCFMLFSAFETKHQHIEEEDHHSNLTSPAPSCALEPYALTIAPELNDVITTVDKVHEPQAEWTQCFENKRTIGGDGHMKAHQELRSSSKLNTGPGSWKFTMDTHHHWLMLYSVLFLVYVQLMAKLFSSIEGWRYLDSFYWMIATALTVGFGDIKPMTSTGRGLVCLVAPIGIVLLGILIYHIGKIVLKEARSTMEDQLKSHKREKESSNLHQENHKIEGRRRIQYDKMRNIEHSARLQCQAITFTVSLTTWLFLWLVGALFFHLCEREQDQKNEDYPQQAKNPRHWTYVESLYMAQAALLTIGYGDFSPRSEAGRSFFVLWSMLAVPTTTVLVASTVDALMDQVGYKKRKKVEQKAGKRFLPQSHSYKPHRNFRHDSRYEDRSQNEKSSRLPKNHESYEKTHIAAMLLKDVIYDHFSDIKYNYDFNSWEWFLYVLGAIDEPPHDEPEHIQEIHDDWNPQKPWDWLGNDTAIASHDSEIQWVLQRLVNKLVRELLEIRLGEDDFWQREGVQ
jgi:hypothetical protein